MANGYYIGLDRTKEIKMACGCGRSPTGQCIGWHGLSEEQYQQKLVEWDKEQFEKAQKVEEAKAKEND